MSDSMLPKVLTDFVFDLYDSVTLSQLTEEQTKLYLTDFADLTGKYFDKQPWPSPQSIASECNGHPLFLALYRELTHRHWHAVSRPTLRDRMEGWQVYRELFEEILELAEDDPNSFFLVPAWAFDILNEFVYQFQGFCQFRSALYTTGRKHGILQPDGSVQALAGTMTGQQQHLVDTLTILQSSKDSWDVELFFHYLHRLVQMGAPQQRTTGGNQPPEPGTETPVHPVFSYLSLFASVALSRLECLLGDYTACLQALTPVAAAGGVIIPKADAGNMTVQQVLNSCFSARISVSYHAGVSFFMLRRYKDASKTLGDMCALLQRGFKTGQLRKLPGSDQFSKQYERMLALLAVLMRICPSSQAVMEDSVVRVIRDKHASKIEAAGSYEEWFQSPKFISIDSSTAHNVYRHQVYMFLKEMESQASTRKLRSYLKLYTSLPVEKLAKFHDMSTEEFLPLLLSYKMRMLQLERSDEEESFIAGTPKTALDIHFYLEKDIVHVDEAEKQRRFEKYFLNQIRQNGEILQEVERISTTV